MKISVITFFDNGNYGSELQSLAMNDYLKEKGHQPVFCRITYTNRFLQAIDTRLNSIRMKIYNSQNNERKIYLNDRKHNLTKQRSISSTLSSHIHSFLTSRLDMGVLSPCFILSRHKYDAFICGSDQIWSALILPIRHQNYLYGIDKKRKIAYAPSMGLDVLPQYYLKHIKKYIRDFKYLSVREDVAKQVIFENYGIEAKQVLDPTMLVGREYWDQQLRDNSRQKPNDNYVFCYFLGEISEEVRTSVVKVADGRKIIILPYEEDCVNVDKGCFELADPLDFVNLIKNADCVFTDSFHGCVFSILFDKQFVVTKRSHVGRVAQTSRITSLLNMFDLKGQFTSGFDNIINAITRPIDYNIVHTLVQNQQKASRAFLNNALSEIEKSIN